MYSFCCLGGLVQSNSGLRASRGYGTSYDGCLCQYLCFMDDELIDKIAIYRLRA